MMIPRLWCFMPLEEVPVITFFSKHPPDEVRYRIIDRILRDNDLGETIDLKDIFQITESVKLENASEEERRIFRDRVGDLKELTPSIMNWLDPIYRRMRNNVHFFTRQNWERSLDVGKYLKGEIDRLPGNLNPSEILNGLLSIRSEIDTLEEERRVMKKTLELF